MFSLRSVLGWSTRSLEPGRSADLAIFSCNFGKVRAVLSRGGPVLDFAQEQA